MTEVVVRYNTALPEAAIDSLMEALPQLVADGFSGPDAGGRTENMLATGVEVRDEAYSPRARNALDLSIAIMARDTVHRRQRLDDTITGIRRWLDACGLFPAGTTYCIVPCLVESRFTEGRTT